MTRRLTFVMLTMLALAATAHAQFQKGDFDLSLSGAGNSDKDFDNTALSFTGSIGYLVEQPLEVGFRQQITWADTDDSTFAGTSSLFVDFYFDLTPTVKPFIGANIGYAYGDGIEDTFLAGPEAGVKWFLNETTYIGVIGSYGFDLENGFDDGAWSYGLTLGMRF